MDGVTIIETISSEVQQGTMESPWIVIVALIAISLAAIYESLVNFASKRKLEGIAPLSVVIVSMFLGLSCLGVFNNNQHTETLYIVTIDETVTAKAFHENYEIVSVNNDTYTVRLKGE